jgi:hypothetical protein
MREALRIAVKDKDDLNEPELFLFSICSEEAEPIVLIKSVYSTLFCR